MKYRQQFFSGLLLIVAGVILADPAFANSCCESHGKEKDKTTIEKPKDPPPINKWAEYYFDKVKQFRQENAKLNKDKKYIVFVGDSITERFPLEKFFPDRSTLNRGITADGIGLEGDDRGLLNRMDESIFDCSPSVIFLLIGVNDLPHPQGPPFKCLEGLREIVDRIERELPDASLILHTAMPTGEKYSRHDFLNPRIIEYNEGIKQLGKERNLPVIDLYPLYSDENGLLKSEMTKDGLHVKVEYYDLWAKELEPYLP